MDGFICLKALRLGGAEYRPGDRVPRGAVLPQRVPVLLAQNYLVKAVQPEAGKEAGTTEKPPARSKKK